MYKQLRDWWNLQTNQNKTSYIRGVIISVVSLIMAWVICFKII
jgi:hypothetical protein